MTILEYALKLTQRPHGMEESDVLGLRDAGLSDGEILDVCQITCYYNYVNRLAAGLGVDVEAWSG